MYEEGDIMSFNQTEYISKFNKVFNLLVQVKRSSFLKILLLS